ncbi:MAG: ATP-binding protein [Candidatus Peregrinibacteria bacterium]|nr:ATP-binding protein [Candidatus Peregrinibacteria bacterium]
MINKTIIEQQNPWWKAGKLDRKMFPRYILPELIKNLKNSKILALVGSRQVGKSSLMDLMIEDLLKSVKPTNILYFNLDDFSIQELFSSPGSFISYLGGITEKKYIFIDEVQRLPSPGLFLKTIYDLHLNIKLVVSGSSQLELRSKLKEFLVGRMRQFEISRLHFEEMLSLNPNIPHETILTEMLTYGGYPDIAKEQNDLEKQRLIGDVYETYLKKDISDFAKIDDVGAFNKLIILLASQIGNLLNINKLSDTLRISEYKVKQYLDILEGTFIIKLIPPFCGNYQKEIRKTPKVFFMDLGLRNYVLKNWGELEMRVDKGALFENAVFLEMYGRDIYKEKNYYYWRTTNQTEIDFVIRSGTELYAIEAKYGSRSVPKSFLTFRKFYHGSLCKVVTPSDVYEFSIL